MSDHRFIEDYCYYKSPIGLIKICETGGFLTRAYFVGEITEEEQNQSLISTHISNLLKDVCIQFDEYFEGIRKKFDLALQPNGTHFQNSAWRSLQRIPYGKTISYLQQAESILKPKASRAVGQANSKNPISIIIPCHRVVGNNGSLTGYSGGLKRKKQLLAMEQRFMHE